MPPRRRNTRARTVRPTAHEAFIDDEGDDAEELPLSDEEGEKGSKDKKIVAKDGQLGFSHGRKGFDPRSNFTLDVYGDIFSSDYQLKGTRY